VATAAAAEPRASILDCWTADGGIPRSAFFRTIPDAAIIGDVVTGRIVRWNPAAERLFGSAAANPSRS
jgi:PAS domain-containing protein